MENKKRIIPLLAFVCFIALSDYAMGGLSTDPIPDAASLNITMINQEPDPAEPGGLVTVRFMIENIGGEPARDVTLELIPKYPFSLYSEGIEQNIGLIQSRQRGKDAVIIKYHLKVDKNAITGNNEISLRYKIGNNNLIELKPFKISVQSHDAILALESYLVSPSMIKPGRTAELKIKLRNTADSLLKNINLKLKLDNVPIAPFGLPNERTIYNLDSKKELEVLFNLIAEPNAEPKAYKVDLLIDYSDELGKKYNKNTTLGLVIGDVPSLNVYIDSTTIYTSGKNGNVNIKFVNKGVAPIKFLNAVVGSSNDFVLLSPKEEYIGKIDSDDYEIIELKMYINPAKKDKITIPLTIDYKDSNNEDYQQTIDLNLPLYSIATAKELGLIKENNLLGILIFAGIIVIGVLFYLAYKRKKKGIT